MAEKMPWGNPKAPAGMDHQSTHRNVNQSQTGQDLESMAKAAVEQIEQFQLMIELNFDHLERLRSTVTHSASALTKQEIRTVEGKLIKHFSKQLATKAGLTPEQLGLVQDEVNQYPSLDLWLSVVGTSPQSAKCIQSKVSTLESLKDKTDAEIHRMVVTGATPGGDVVVTPSLLQQQDLRRLTRAIQHLRKYTDVLLHSLQPDPKLELYWDSWTREGDQQGSTPSSGSDPTSWSRKPSSSTSPPLPPPPPAFKYGGGGGLITGGGRKATPPSSQRIPSTPVGAFKQEELVNMASSVTAGPFGEKDEGSPVPTSTTLSMSSSTASIGKLSTVTTPSMKGGGAGPTVSIGGGGGALSKPSSVASISCAPSGTSVAAASAESPPVPKSPKSPPIFEPTDPQSTGVQGHHPPGPHLQVPPKSPAPSMGHVIKHRFKKTLAPGKCDFCFDYFITGLKCKECKYKCHKECEYKVPPSCGLPSELIDYFKQFVTAPGQPATAPPPAGHSPRLPHSPGGGSGSDRSSAGSDHHHHHPPYGNRFRHPDSGLSGGVRNNSNQVASGGGSNIPYAAPGSSSTTSSCTSSTPTTPADQVSLTPPNSAHPPFRGNLPGSGGPVPGGHPSTNFPFPDPAPTPSGVQPHSISGSVTPGKRTHLAPSTPAKIQGQDTPQLSAFVANSNVAPISSPILDSIKSYDSDKTLSGSSGSGTTAVGRSDSQDSRVSYEDPSWGGGNHNRHHSISYREWDIPYEEIAIGAKIGSGRFSTVHKGSWRGDVAVKLLHEGENVEDEATLEAFRKEVATFRKTRHENLILFMGQSRCSDPPRLAIVTSLCKGNTLYTTLHLRRDKFSMSKIVIIAQQITNGMGYLHDKGIVHKDLKSKNVFLENGRAIITDFGLVNVARKLCSTGSIKGKGKDSAKKFTFDEQQHRECMSIPKGWLCYLAPEIMQNLRVRGLNEDLPFTKASDVYAFGTIWFELLTGEWPWKLQPPETVIWSVGRGVRPTLANLQASRDVKDILVLCWRFNRQERPNFTELNSSLEKIPKKRLARSPSHPVHLSRSAEAVF